MDPITALTTAGAVVKIVSQVSITLFTFIQDMKQVNHNLSSFFVEVQVLKTALTSIADSLQSTSLRKSTNNKAEVDLWDSIDDALNECNKTCEELLEVLQGIGGNHTDPGSFKQAIRQIKLNWESENISLIRSRIQSHTTSLQLALQVINVYKSSLQLKLSVSFHELDRPSESEEILLAVVKSYEKDPGTTDTLDALLASHILAEVYFSKIYQAAKDNKIEVARALLDNGVNVDEMTLGFIPLLAAAKSGHVDIVRF
jgi:hypothetical protein